MRRLLALALITLAMTGCARPAPAGPVRTPEQAADIAQRTLKDAGLDEALVSTRREGAVWVVTTRWRESSVAGHLVTVAAATGQVRVERYRSVELVPTQEAGNKRDPR